MGAREIDALLAINLFELDAVEREVVFRPELGFNNSHVTAIYGAESQPWPPSRDKPVNRWVIPGGPGDYCEVEHYSTTWEGMGQVVEAMKARGYGLYLFAWRDGGAIAEFRCSPAGRPGRNRVVSDGAPMAVALACLAALGVRVERDDEH